MIRILQTNPLNTVQDLGRFGFRNIGVTSSGAMDSLALVIGNVLVGNDDGAPAIEVQTFPFRAEFDCDTAIAVTGADCSATRNGERLPGWWMTPIKKGQILELSAPKTSARAYVAVAGGIKVDAVMGSASTSLRGAFGGHEGRFLQTGDCLEINLPEGGVLPTHDFGVEPPHIALADYFPMASDGTLAIRAVPSTEYALFGAEAERFWAQNWKISSQSDRTGYRLNGEPILLPSPVELRSHGVVPGVVQIPPAGEPIIQMSDANTAGGYPKIAGVIEVDLWRMGQARIGSHVRFMRSSAAEARKVERALKAYIDDIRATSALLSQSLRTIAKKS
ncbi:biotin-dependent carboxyltransferase family protein [Brucella pituitosa]|uniref:5-oxoprolinase subunit C family protein n=1 Tax=Brucella pituitosa TaxID=571256 RepID=UPI003F4A8898